MTKTAEVKKPKYIDAEMKVIRFNAEGIVSSDIIITSDEEEIEKDIICPSEG